MGRVRYLYATLYLYPIMGIPPEHFTTATGRLASMCQRLATSDHRQTIAAAWGGVLGINETETFALMIAMQHIDGMVRNARAELGQLNERHRHQVLAHWPKMETLTAIRNWDESWSAKAHLVAVPVPEILLSAHFNLDVAEPRERVGTIVSRIHLRLTALLHDVVNATDLPADLRALLQRLLEEGKHAVRQYELFGADALLRTMDGAGRIVTENEGLLEANRDHVLVQRTMRTMTRLEKIIVWANKNAGASALLGVTTAAVISATGGIVAAAVPVLLSKGTSAPTVPAPPVNPPLSSDKAPSSPPAPEAETSPDPASAPSETTPV